MAAASAISVTRRASFAALCAPFPAYASTSDDTRRMLNDLDDASARVNALAPKSAFNVTAGPPQKTGVNRRTGYCWCEMAGE